MHICIVTHVFPLNVMSPEKIEGSFIVPFIKELQRQGHRVTVFTPGKKGRVIDDPSILVVRFNWFDIGKTLGNMSVMNPFHIISLASLYIHGCRELSKLVKGINVDHCIAMWAVPSGNFARYAQKKTGVPYSVWCLGTDIHSAAKKPVLRKFVSDSLSEASKLFADGISFAKDVERLSKRHCEFIPTLRINETIKSSKVVLPEEIFHFLYIGRLEKVKGIDVLLDAFQELSKKTKDVFLTIIGEGSMLEHLREKIEAYGNQSLIDLKGYVSDEMRMGYLVASDCQVIPSRNESIPLVMTEAVKSGIKLIVSDVGDMGSLAKKYKFATVVPSENAKALSDAMLKIMNEDIESDILREKYLDMFDLPDIVNQIVKSIS